MRTAILLNKEDRQNGTLGSDCNNCIQFSTCFFWIMGSCYEKMEGKDAKSQMLIGLGHDRIIYQGLKYIERYAKEGEGISQDEYENLYEYLYKPYHDLGGNGSAERVMEEVKKIPIHK